MGRKRECRKVGERDERREGDRNEFRGMEG